MQRIVLRKRRMRVPRGDYVVTERVTHEGRGMGHVFVEVKARFAHPISDPEKGNSSATRSGVQYASRSSRASISSGYSR